MSLTQENYESAFVRLEEMKEKRMTPPERVYDSLVRRLVGAGDARAEMALEDMVHCVVEPVAYDLLLQHERLAKRVRDRIRKRKYRERGGCC